MRSIFCISFVQLTDQRVAYSSFATLFSKTLTPASIDESTRIAMNVSTMLLAPDPFSTPRALENNVAGICAARDWGSDHDPAHRDLLI